MKPKKIRKKANKNKGKKSVSNIITIIFIIILAILLVIFLWNFLKRKIMEDSEVVEAQAKLFAEEIKIKNVDIFKEDIINLTLRKGPGKLILSDTREIQKYVDIVFLIDSTGSMYDEINSVSKTISSFTDKLIEQKINFRLALIEFRDYPYGSCGYSTDFPYKVHLFNGETETFTTDIDTYKKRIEDIRDSVSGGADAPESHLSALNESFKLDYLPDSEDEDVIIKRINILLTDDRPHAKDCLYSVGSPSNTWASCYKGPETIKEITDELIKKKIIFYYINRDDPKALCQGEDLSESTTDTGGKFYSYTNAEAIQTSLENLATEFINVYKQEKWNYLKVMFYSESNSCQYIIDNTPLPLETKTYTLPNPIDSNDPTLNECLDGEPLKSIKIYPVIRTSFGKEVFGPVLDVWTSEK